MYSQLFFFLLALSLMAFIPKERVIYWIENPFGALQTSLLLFLFLLCLQFFQTKYLRGIFRVVHGMGWWILVNVEILVFLGVSLIGFGAQRFFQLEKLNSYQTPSIFFFLFLYFCALWWSHLWDIYFHLHQSLKKSMKSAFREILFLFPFCIPFLTFSLLFDGLEYLGIWKIQSSFISYEMVLGTTTLTVLATTLAFLPTLMMICWNCRPLEESDLKDRLNQRCDSMKFKHAGLKIWNIIPNFTTAGIIGVVGTSRYVLFTPSLIKRFTSEEIEAILIHEIGHNEYKHLLYYPLIMFGMLISGMFLFIGLDSFFSLTEFSSVEANRFFVLMSLFLLYALAIGIYFRLVFGFFSRLFERQADLHIFSTNFPPKYLIQALDRLGDLTGGSHSQPNWHHHSLQERIQFLEKAEENPLIISQHHKFVKKWLIVYFFVLILACMILSLIS